jgi:hypothetical protein
LRYTLAASLGYTARSLGPLWKLSWSYSILAFSTSIQREIKKIICERRTS